MTIHELIEQVASGADANEALGTMLDEIRGGKKMHHIRRHAKKFPKQHRMKAAQMLMKGHSPSAVRKAIKGK